MTVASQQQRRTICVFTGTRAEYGLLRWLMKDIAAHPRLRLVLVVSGSHLASDYGETWRSIDADGFSIDAKVDMKLDSDEPSALAKSMALGLSGCAEALNRLKPDMLVVLGDRYEALAAAEAALLLRVPVAHIHGGELTEGAIDDAVRHALTKMAHLHFAAAEPYRRRIIQMGESPDRVFTVGAPGVDNIKRLKRLDRREFEAAIQMELGKSSFLVTYHPETLESRKQASECSRVEALLAALDSFNESRIILTYPNADPGSRKIIDALNRYAAARPQRTVICPSLGQQRYLSALTHVDAVIGNSSSGIIEAPAAGVPTVNIGDRQKGRIRSTSVIDCEQNAPAIAAAIRQALTPEFRQIAKATVPAYGAGDTARRICEIVATFPLDQLHRKVFYDAT